MTLKELMQLCYGEGQTNSYQPGRMPWREWWEKYGKDRHDDYMIDEDRPPDDIEDE